MATGDSERGGPSQRRAVQLDAVRVMEQSVTDGVCLIGVADDSGSSRRLGPARCLGVVAPPRGVFHADRVPVLQLLVGRGLRLTWPLGPDGVDAYAG